MLTKTRSEKRNRNDNRRRNGPEGFGVYYTPPHHYADKKLFKTQK
jgi:hypothetical protein